LESVLIGINLEDFPFVKRSGVGEIGTSEERQGVFVEETELER